MTFKHDPNLNQNIEMLKPSKSQLKRDAERCQKIGEMLTALTLAQLKKIPMPDDLAEAIMIAKKITSHSALKRQRQLIGKMIRALPLLPIEQALAKLNSGHVENVRVHHCIEKWTQQLIENDMNVLQEIIAEMPDIDLQLVRQLSRNARKNTPAGETNTAAKQLFRLLHAQFQKQHKV